MVEYVMQDSGVGREEANRRLGLQGAIGKFVALVREKNPETFAGAWIESEVGRYAVVVSFKGEAPPMAKGLDKGFGVEVRQARWSEHELQQTMRQVVELRTQGPAERWNQFTIVIEIEDNQVVIWSPEPEITEQRLAPQLSGELAEMVSVFPHPVESGADGCPRGACNPDFMAGLTFGGREGQWDRSFAPTHLCTAGFTVKKNDSRETGFLTAGHCMRPVEHNGERIGEVLGDQDQGNLDTQWASLSPTAWRPTSQIWTSDSGRLNVSGSYPRNLVVKGRVVSMSGSTTGVTAGKVTYTNLSPRYVQGSWGFIGADYKTAGGDSGGPVYITEYSEGRKYDWAVGINSGTDTFLELPNPFPKTVAVFSLVADAEAMFGVRVLTQAPLAPSLLWLLRNSNSAGLVDVQWEFGNAVTDQPLAGDWSAWYLNGGSRTDVPGVWTQDPRSQPGVYDGIKLDREGKPRITFGAGRALAGDFNGDGIDEAATFNQGLWNVEGVGAFYFGAPGDWPVAGNFDGYGGDNWGVWRPGDAKFYVTTVWGTVVLGPFGVPGDVPIAGNWDGIGADEVGVYRGSEGRFYLATASGTSAFYFGGLYEKVVVGDWDGDGIDTVGVVRPI